MKKIIISLFVTLTLFIQNVFGAQPKINNFGLPGKGGGGGADGKNFFVGLIDEFIAIILALAVFALIFSGIYYLISAGNDEKTGKAKKWIIWSLVGVFLATLSWGIVNFFNNINLSL